jgi:hypothetical protein
MFLQKAKSIFQKKWFTTLNRPLLDEEIAVIKFKEWLKQQQSSSSRLPMSYEKQVGDPSHEEWIMMCKASLATFLLHVNSRVFSSQGKAFYTIGPCGEEFAASFGLLLEDNDSCALHYRHLASQISRQLKQGKNLEEIFLERARGYVCSKLDPVTGGRHCALVRLT